MVLFELGFLAEFIGGLLIILVELPPIKKRLAPTVLEEARRQLYDTSSLVDGNPKFNKLVTVVENQWEGELAQHPATFLLEKPGPMERSLLAIYDKDSEGPFGERMKQVQAGEEPDPVTQENVWESDKWDWICAKQVLDGWVNEEIQQRNWKIRVAKWIGAGMFAVGFIMQIPSILA